MAAMPPEATMKTPAAEAPEEEEPGGEPLMEVTLCLYPGGKLTVEMGDGEKHPVPDLETALTAIRRLAETEMKEPGEIPEGEEPAGEEAEEERAMMQGFGG